ncbi:MAG: M23 family metallopeptidase [Thermoleophilia bacterium]
MVLTTLALTAVGAHAQVPTNVAASSPSAPPPGEGTPAQAPAPTTTQPAPVAPAPAATAPTAPTAPAATTAPTTVAVVLKQGSRGQAVRDLQRELRRRGLKVRVDGAFGPATKRAVMRMQKRLKQKPTGIATTALLKRLGLQTRAAAATPAPVVARGSSPYLKVFPLVGKYTYTDDFGARRHQGPHEGNDLMSARGTTIVAVDNAVVERLTRTEKGLGGIYVWLKRADGVEYYYAHMNSIVDGLQEGQRVAAGDILGGVGNTGDARYGATHLHFEIRPKGVPIDPYPHLRAVDPAVTAAGSK